VAHTGLARRRGNADLAGVPARGGASHAARIGSTRVIAIMASKNTLFSSDIFHEPDTSETTRRLSQLAKTWGKAQGAQATAPDPAAIVAAALAADPAGVVAAALGTRATPDQPPAMPLPAAAAPPPAVAAAPAAPATDPAAERDYLLQAPRVLDHFQHHPAPLTDRALFAAVGADDYKRLVGVLHQMRGRGLIEEAGTDPTFGDTLYRASLPVGA
jgi:hypothetical protein